MFELNGTYVIFVVSFLVFMALLNEIMLKPVGKAIAERESGIKGDIQAAAAHREQAAGLLSKYEEDVRGKRQEAQRVISESSEQANKEKSAKLGEVAQRGKTKLEAAKQEIQGERDRLIDEMVVQQKELVDLITTKVIPGGVS